MAVVSSALTYSQPGLHWRGLRGQVQARKIPSAVGINLRLINRLPSDCLSARFGIIERCNRDSRPLMPKLTGRFDIARSRLRRRATRLGK